MTSYILADHAKTIGTNSVKNQKAHATFRADVIEFFTHCATVAEAETLVTAIYKAHTNSRQNKADQAAAFSAARSSINKILKSQTFPFIGKTPVSAKTPDKKTGICRVTEVQPPKGGKNQKRAATVSTASKTEQSNDVSKDLAKVAGPEYDDRLFAVMQAMRATNINASDLIPDLFKGLTPQAQADCIKSLQSIQKPVLANKAKIKKLQTKVNTKQLVKKSA